MPLPKSRYVYIGNDTVACRYCEATGALPRPGREPVVQHAPTCPAYPRPKRTDN